MTRDWSQPDGTTELKCPDCGWYDYAGYVDEGRFRLIRCSKCGFTKRKLLSAQA